MFVCCECRVLLGSGLCGELITCPEESYRLWCVVVCDLGNLKNEEAMTRIGSQRHIKNILYNIYIYISKLRLNSQSNGDTKNNLLILKYDVQHVGTCCLLEIHLS
jgi:hypothetical protein